MTTRGRRWWTVAAGAAAAAVYLLVAAATPRITGRDVRPLFEGFTPAAPYRWVNPPKEFASGNQPPKPNTTEIDLGPTGNGPSGANSEDNQLVLNIPAGAIPPHPPDTKALVKIIPTDPAKLGAPPAGVHRDGNAYQILMSYSPSGAEIASLTAAGNAFMIVPDPATDIIFSVDGQSWQSLGAQRIGGSSVNVGTTFQKAGYYLAVSSGAPPSAPKHNAKTGTIIAALAGVIGLALLVGFGPALVRRVGRGGKKQQPPPSRSPSRSQPQKRPAPRKRR
ncbi:MAG TPA: hypothetical protein VFA94_08735 [Acidimicrobiales bacterium]|nr:hypothetical protein [Acidimicrobiales bacterium]